MMSGFWYLFQQIVDFCCGSNDFSCLMNTKLEETGKKCLYKNYDLFQAKVMICLCACYCRKLLSLITDTEATYVRSWCVLFITLLELFILLSE